MLQPIPRKLLVIPALAASLLLNSHCVLADELAHNDHLASEAVTSKLDDQNAAEQATKPDACHDLTSSQTENSSVLETVQPEPVAASPENIKPASPNAEQIPTQTDNGISLNRIQGPNRYANAAALSQAGWERTDQVILTSGDSQRLADALTGTPLAHQLDAPILLTKSKHLSPETLAEIKRLGASRVTILGGENSVGNQVSQDLSNAGLAVERIGGLNRFDQAAQVADRLMADKPGKYRAFLVNGSAYADAAAIAAIAARQQLPIYLTKANQIHPSLQAHLHRISHLTLIGGNKSLSKQLENQLHALGVATDRISGKNRYQLNQNILNHYGIPNQRLLLVSGEHSSDALPAANLAAKTHQGLLMVKNDNLATIRDQVNFCQTKNIKQASLVGGGQTLSLQTAYYFANPKALKASWPYYQSRFGLPIKGIRPLTNQPVITKEMIGGNAIGVADPFLVRDPASLRYYLFFEILRDRRYLKYSSDEIGYAYSDNLKDWHYGGLALPYKQERQRYAYPNVFYDQVDQAWYMTPDSSNHIASLYRAKRFPDRWERMAHLFYDKHRQFVDTNIFRYQGQVYLTTTNLKEDGVSLYYSANNQIVGGDWRLHPNSKQLQGLYKGKHRRGAGRVFVDEARGVVYMPTQVMEKGIYGYGTYLTEIKNLTPKRATFKNLGRYSKASDLGDWRHRSMHQVSYEKDPTNSFYVFAVDGQNRQGEYRIGLYRQRV
ncbi:hypothetical protein AWM75_00790 [Aerococcus urinaehominis]|uniref:Glucosamine inositolphosphorylceramide transferase 1 N-terminal domain-containing protein n=1 Tax=Aerococcus urinaehominis TaxID=128944 RepID=A0A120IAN6_9LACT|nr:cell wall-binding repeat-containing protein [Aerococcus urinaehominis]AMB98618.1 hypothetical protein AWM75_00790 [Aerococcus urinaehominis]SDL95453.1 Putative cell wall binding repeat 2 [Aerococcus urinaehominis]